MGTEAERGRQDGEDWRASPSLMDRRLAVEVGMVCYMLKDGVSAGRVAEIMRWPIGDVIAHARFRAKKPQRRAVRKRGEGRPPRFYRWENGQPVMRVCEVRNGQVREAAL